MHDQIERNFFDPRQPTKESLIELGLENRNPIIIAKVSLFLLCQLHGQVKYDSLTRKIIPNNST